MLRIDNQLITFYLNILKKTLNNFFRNCEVFLEKLRSVTAEIVQCFFGSGEPSNFAGSKSHP